MLQKTFFRKCKTQQAISGEQNSHLRADVALLKADHQL